MPGPVAPRAIGSVYIFKGALRLRSAWRLSLIACCVAATAAATAQPTIGLVHQPESVRPEGFSDDVKRIAAPSPGAALAAYQAVQARIRKWDAAAPAGDPTTGLSLSGAAVTLRFEHRIVGRGKAFATEAANPTAGADVLALAVQRAMDEVERRRPVSPDAVGQNQRVTDAQALSISLEVAGGLVPFEPATYAEMDLAVQAGLEGIAVRVDDQLAGVFPSAMLTSGSSPADAACAAISEASNDPMLAIKTSQASQPAALAESHGVRLYRFRVTHLAQASPSARPEFLFRSGRVVAQRDVTTAAINDFSTLIAANLRGKLVSARAADGTEGLKVIGAYAASRGPAAASEATPEAAAIVALAMRMYAASLPVDSPDRIDFEQLGGEVAVAAMRAETPMSATTAAAVVACVAEECARDSVSHATFQPAFGVLLASVDENGSWAKAVPTERRGLVSFGLARAAKWGGALEAEAPFRSRANAAIVSVLKEASTRSMSEAMPWLFMADRDLGTADTTDGRLPRTGAFVTFRDSLWKMQLTADDAGEDGPDLVGGFAFLDPRSPLPTGASVPLVAFLGACLADPSTTPQAERMPELVRLLRSVRFIRQLTVDEWSAYSAAAPEIAMGGVRAALWDETLDPETQALALIAIMEVRRAILLVGGSPVPVRPAAAP